MSPSTPPSVVKTPRPEVDLVAITSLMAALGGAAQAVLAAGPIAHEVRTAFGLTIAFMQHEVDIKPGRLAKIERGETSPTVDEAYLVLDWAHTVAETPADTLAKRVAKAALPKTDVIESEVSDRDPDLEPIA